MSSATPPERARRAHVRQLAALVDRGHRMNGTLGAALLSNSEPQGVILTGCTGQANPCSADALEGPMQHTPKAWRMAFHDDGFVVVKDLLEPALVSRLRESMDQITGGIASLRPHLQEKIFL